MRGDGLSWAAIGCGTLALLLLFIVISMAISGGVFAGAAWLLNYFTGTQINIWTAFVVGVLLPPLVRLTIGASSAIRAGD